MTYNLEETIEFVARRHMGQVDKGGAPYILHLLRVMLSVEPPSDAARTVALLHDIVEDTRTDLHELYVMFTAEVVMAVDAITRRDREPYEEYIRRVVEDPLARAVKIADLQDNLDPSRRGWAVDDQSKAELQRLRARYERALRTLGAEGDCREARGEAAPEQQNVQNI